MRVSVAIPVFNEEDVLGELLNRVNGVLDHIPGGPHEIVMVDDGSSDRTALLLREAAAENPRIIAVELSRNFGHQIALSAALDHTTGDVVVMMDGDLQDSPEAIPRFLEQHEQGYDVVYAQRVGRKESRVLRSCYFLFYRIIGRLSSIELPLDSGDFSLVSRRIVDELKRMKEKSRYIRGLRSWVGFRQIGIEVERDPRASGSSKYTIAGLVRLAFDGIFAFSIAPLRATTVVGFGAVLASAFYAGYAVLAKLLLDRSPQGFTALIVVIVFLFGVQFLILGVLGEYIGRIYEETKQRPQYVVRRLTGDRMGDPDA